MALAAAFLGWMFDGLEMGLFPLVARPALRELMGAEAQENIGTSDKPRHRSPATINRYLAALSHAFTIAIKEWQWLSDNPVLKISKPKEPRGRVRRPFFCSGRFFMATT